MLTCRELLDFMHDYQEGHLESGVLKDFEWHLERCTSCRSYLDSYRRSTELVRALQRSPESAPGPEVPEDLVRAILASLPRHVG